MISNKNPMVLAIYLISIFIVHLVIASPQINLDLTDWTDQDQNIVLQHNCLHVATSIGEFRSREIISYCMDESPSKWEIDQNTLVSMFTFAELSRMNVTSEQLYRWSGPMNVIERYQFYLNLMAIYNVSSSSLAAEVFYNCTLPRFGPQCQYSLDAYQSYHSSLNEIIEDHYLQATEPETLTCYTHLQCDRGSSLICLDWSEICDGKIDCIDGKDEEHCFSLMNNNCANDEYRCNNGQCIPKTFFNDGSNNFDCLDRSDEPQNRFEHFQSAHNKPTLVNENVICSWRDNLRNDYMDPSLTSSCITKRRWIIEQTMFSDRSNTVPDDCLLAFQCLHNIPNFNNPLCSSFCEGEQCAELIENTCPGRLYVPLGPIAYGHIYLAFTKESAVNTTYPTRIPPTYICYNEQLCGAFPPNRTLPMNLTCRRPEDFPIVFVDPSGQSYLSYIKPLFSKLSSCNSITTNPLVTCNGSHVYQCKNSSKCIPKLYVGDGIPDCAYNDDEEQATFDELCMTDQSNLFFKCQTTNRCIRRDQVEDYRCDCPVDEYDLCDDENLRLNEIRRTITFSNICNGFVDLLPVMIDGQIETDETNCEYWPCNNTYTRCDGYWNCLDGSDEINCDPSPLIQCPPYHHICVSSVTNQLMCLPIERANDGSIDCLGGTDEPSLCPVINDHYNKEKKFYCDRDGDPSCIQPWLLCDGTVDCKNGDDEQFCGNNSTNTDAQNFFNRYFNPSQKLKSAHSPLNKPKPTAMTSRSLMKKQSEQHCQRGVPLRVWLDIANNLSTTTCLCPPSYYGDQCQYQNERVSLTMQLNAIASAQRTLFILVISLIDDSYERIIHSYQQMTYIYVRDENTKFNFYLLYSTRPKDTKKTYAIHIDIYEKMTLNYRGSFSIPLKFPFLPVERIAVKFNLPQVSDPIRTCDNSYCVHGQCNHYINDPKDIIFCRCNAGWTGRYCNIPHMCTCSSDSLCVGVDANNRSICVCPSNKFGAQCLLDNKMRQVYSYSRCYNGGVCLPADEYTTAYESCYCLCPKGFSENKCEIPDTKIILSFDKDIRLSLPSVISLRFIYLNGSTAPVDDHSWQIVCPNGTTTIGYWARPFHMAFVQIFELDLDFPYYLISDHNSSDIIRTITPIDRCRSLYEIFDESMIQKTLLQRIKHYHLLCQNLSLNLSCFYDEIHMCVCQDDQRFANCFKFDRLTRFNDIDIDNNKIESECAPDYSFNSSTSTISLTSSPSPTSLTSSLSPTSLSSSPSPTPPTTSGISSIHACEHFLYIFILLICCLYIHYSH
jgi:hypothetical protein